MACKLVFLLAVFGVASAELPYPRTCEQVESQDTPTLCSNYKNIEALNKVQTELQNSEAGVEKRITAVEAKVTQLEDARTEFEAQLKDIQSASTASQIAFSAILKEHGQNFRESSRDNIGIFNKILINAGSAYNQSTGVFTAPVNGIYFFTFTTFGNDYERVGVRLMKNGECQVSTYSAISTDVTDSSTNTVILRLDATDTVYLQLFPNVVLADNNFGCTTFSGFLVSLL